MKLCKAEDCEYYACCNHCIHLYLNIDESEWVYICRLHEEEVDPLDLCEDFDCCNNY